MAETSSNRSAEEGQRQTRGSNAYLEDSTDRCLEEVVLFDNGRAHGPLSDARRNAFEDILTALLTWNRKDRATLDDVLGYLWLNTSFEGNDSGPWIERYSAGRSYQVRGKTYIE
jgi:hypothetical protein